MSHSNPPNLPKLVKQAQAGVRQRLNGLLREVGLTQIQWQVLKQLSNTPNINIQTLRKQLNLVASHLIPILNALEKAGLIEYCANPDNENNPSIYLTNRGHFLLQRLSPKVAFLYSQVERQKRNPSVQKAYKQIASFFKPKKK